MIEKKILVTGSQGFIGSHLLKELINMNNKIIGINIKLDKKTKNYLPLKKDILKIRTNEIPYNLDGIVHLAAITDVEFCNKNPQKCFMINVIGTQNVLDIARKKNCKFVYVSTSHVYGKPMKLPIKENHPKNPTSIYSASKLAGEICCEAFAKSYGMDVSIVRLFSVYGSKSPPHLVTSRIISQLNHPSIKLGNIKPKRDFIFVSDACKGIVSVLKKTQAFNTYNIGSGHSHSIGELCRIIMQLSGKKLPVKSIKTRIRKNEIDEIVANISKIKNLGWKPTVGIKEGLTKTLSEYNK